MLRRYRGQATLMYAALIAMVAAALISMSPYVKRALQEKYRQAADTYGYGDQYEKGFTEITDDY